ncbi:MAG: hypothetical protein IKE59_07120 [Erysipelotrichaceae bacterium]|nr:hypothetical protein [Erysipelotrichaceae bacterium]
MTYESKRQKYIDEENERKRQQKQYQQSQPPKEQPRYTGSGYSGPSFSLGGFLLGAGGLALPFIFNGVLVLVLAILGKIFSPVMPLFSLIWELFWMLLTCWIRVLKIWFTGAKYDTFFPNLRIRWVFPVEIAIAVFYLLRTVYKSFRGDYDYEDGKNIVPLIVFPVLEVLHSLFTIGTYNTYGTLKSVANGLFLGMQLLLVAGWIIRGVDRIRYR